jgi:peptide/nickel transport system permease protein
MANVVAHCSRSPRVLIALGMVLGISACAIFAGSLAPHDPAEQNLLSILTPPIWQLSARHR